MLQAFNGKFLLIPAVMFSLFYDPASNGTAQVVTLTIALAGLIFSANLLWLAGGKILASVVEEEWFARYQGKVFGSILVATAIWIAMG